MFLHQDPLIFVFCVNQALLTLHFCYLLIAIIKTQLKCWLHNHFLFEILLFYNVKLMDVSSGFHLLYYIYILYVAVSKASYKVIFPGLEFIYLIMFITLYWSVFFFVLLYIGQSAPDKPWFVNSHFEDLFMKRRFNYPPLPKLVIRSLAWDCHWLTTGDRARSDLPDILLSPDWATVDTGLADWWEILLPGWKAEWKINGFNAAAIVTSKHHIYLLIFGLPPQRSISIWVIHIGLDLSFCLFTSICLSHP